MNAALDPIEVATAAATDDVNLDNAIEAERPGREECPDMPYHSFTGEVVSGSTWSETYISGGNTTMVGSGRYASAVTSPITSTVVNQTEFWVRRSDGEEGQFNIPHAKANFRAGHTVSVIYLLDNGKVKIQQIYNHSTGALETVAGPELGNLHGALILGGIPANIFGFLMIMVGTSGVQGADAGHFALGAGLMLGNIYYVWLAKIVGRHGRAAEAVAAWIKRNRIR